MSTVFTADVVEFNFTPEKYAEAVSEVTAELTIAIAHDWQGSINTWWTNAGPKVQKVADEFIDAQNPQPSLSQAREQALQAIVYRIAVDAGYYTGTASSSLTTGGQLVAEQFKLAFEAVLGAYTTLGNPAVGQSGVLAPNELAMDENKIIADMGLDSNGVSLVPPGGSGSQVLLDANVQTTILGALLNAGAFRPVLERLIAGGNFAVGDLDNTVLDTPAVAGPLTVASNAVDLDALALPAGIYRLQNDADATSYIQFTLDQTESPLAAENVTGPDVEMNPNTVSSFTNNLTQLVNGDDYSLFSLGSFTFQGQSPTDYISDGSKLIFPVKITVADDGETNGESDGNTVNGLTFQLNLSFSNDPLSNGIDTVINQTEIPVITLNGEPVVNIAQTALTPYVDAGATTNDGSAIVVSGDVVQANVVGAYTINYDATNLIGSAVTVTRLVNVV